MQERQQRLIEYLEMHRVLTDVTVQTKTVTHSAIHKCSRNTAAYYRPKEFALQFVYSVRIYVLYALNAVIYT